MSDSEPKIAPWENVALRTIAIYKLFHATFFIAVGFGLLRLRHHDVAQFLTDYLIVPYHLNSEDQIVDWLLIQASNLTSHKLSLLGYAAFFYAALFAAEGIGLYLRKRWAEYLVVVVTGSLLPLEIYEIYIYAAWWKFVIVFGNVLIVLYLIHRLLLDSSNDLSEKSEKESSPSTASPSTRPEVSKVP
jgi:uncharacterized membrane protein (DUF2068 family)